MEKNIYYGFFYVCCLFGQKSSNCLQKFDLFQISVVLTCALIAHYFSFGYTISGAMLIIMSLVLFPFQLYLWDVLRSVYLDINEENAYRRMNLAWASKR